MTVLLFPRRFRQRRKAEQTHSELEAHQLEGRNRRLRERVEELESKIRYNKQSFDTQMCEIEAFFT